ncbi:spermatogenesis associated 2-like isoform X1 [Misgurnus anguillicaudatus]|uniref:spermatogenesis associated 2-like isoform X1 n=1 Tax=Misgurnus anguillicaudatus TaxID=75329 RepID=UPI003CCF1D61
MMSKSLSDSQCAAKTRRSSIRMSSLSRKNRAGHDFIKKYQSHLESRIEKGDQSLVCRDEKICKEAETLLTKGNAQKILKLDGLDSLAVIENSLQAFPFKTGLVGLEKISKAFEVLELAALNLYLYPWRKEYKFVKMFSGMFTHFIKPALTLQQARELFGLLGYLPASHNEEEELELDSKPVPAAFILCLASAFFAARIECQLLLFNLGSVDTSVESVLRLVKERQEGHSLCVALENIKRELEASHASDAKLTELDLYTDENLPQANASHVASTSSPPHSFYMQSNETLQRDPSQSDGLNNKNSGQEPTLYASEFQCQINNSVSLSQNPGPLKSIVKEHMAGDPERQTAEVEGVMCSCTTTTSLYMYLCENCRNIHRGDCEYYKNCKTRGHTLGLCSEEVGQHQEKNAPLSKDLLKNHRCMEKPTSDTFLVCYSCQLIHDHSCTDIIVCQLRQHFVQSTGTLLTVVNAPERHTCLTPEAPVYVICSTCNYAHDCLCTQVTNCKKYLHEVQYRQELGVSETHNTPMEFHQCCAANHQSPEIACLICKVFHASLCPGTWECSLKHKIHHLGNTCVTCFSEDVSVLCRYCCLQYCKKCWFKEPMSCKCGNPFQNYTAV